MRVSARGLDGVVEAIEHESKWVVGVQWHPEDTDDSVEDRRALFSAFVGRAAVHAALKHSSQTSSEK
ncbi:gamma-glutamyl-gamma-aminobutyrate hydrolase family protein [Rhodococcus sp. ABRD24]|uniref:gamma-glutamyl-gamma-aminobutyrate hydrolase family protein n=1 Tax=Rhodococcus sp. ABRD24 TaxID=2507582 RepID=UPI001A955F88|nr:gamma-glutamyl-gamma-aminobutyrate hydrolase family protein [Rhodococcus sp. ABRD24]